MTFGKGLGHFVIPIGFAIPIGIEAAISRIWGPAFYRAHDQLFPSLSYFAGAVLIWVIGRLVNSRPRLGEFEVVSVRAHHFWGIRFEYWAIPFALLALLVAVPWERLTNYRPSGIPYEPPKAP